MTRAAISNEVLGGWIPGHEAPRNGTRATDAQTWLYHRTEAPCRHYRVRVFSRVAFARTFGWQNDLDQMRNMGLIRGASLENAVCFNSEGPMNPGGLRSPDECCRHKALDLIGDLALLGRPLLGHVIAERAGHAMHAALVARIMSDPSLYEIIT